MPSSQPVGGHLAVKDEFISPERKQPTMAKPSEPNRNSSYNPKKPHITETAITKSNWYKHVNWLNVSLIVGIPLYGLIQAIWTPLRLKTALFAVAYYFMTGLGITAGQLHQWTVNNAIRRLTFLIRIPSTVGAHFLLGNSTPSNLPRCLWWWSCRGFRKMVGQRSSCSPPLHRHREGPILSSQGPPILPFRLDVDEAKPETYRAH